MEDIGEEFQPKFNFRVIYSITQVLGIIIVVLVGVWVESYRGGLGWTSEPGLQFNWHPLLMVLGMIFLYANCKTNNINQSCVNHSF